MTDWLSTDCRRCDVERMERQRAAGEIINSLTHRMIVCPTCGDKRCPRADFHDNPCSKETCMAHHRDECEHGVMVSQCRCPGPKTINIVPCPPRCTANTEESPVPESEEVIDRTITGEVLVVEMSYDVHSNRWSVTGAGGRSMDNLRVEFRTSTPPTPGERLQVSITPVPKDAP